MVCVVGVFVGVFLCVFVVFEPVRLYVFLLFVCLFIPRFDVLVDGLCVHEFVCV